MVIRSRSQDASSHDLPSAQLLPCRPLVTDLDVAVTFYTEVMG